MGKCSGLYELLMEILCHKIHVYICNLSHDAYDKDGNNDNNNTHNNNYNNDTTTTTITKNGNNNKPINVFAYELSVRLGRYTMYICSLPLINGRN